MKQFEWPTKCCSGIFTAVYFALIHAQGGCSLWLILQLYSHEWPTPLSLICLLLFIYMCCHCGLWSVT
jgi:uncharacterized membrane protein